MDASCCSVDSPNTRLRLISSESKTVVEAALNLDLAFVRTLIGYWPDTFGWINASTAMTGLHHLVRGHLVGREVACNAIAFRTQCRHSYSHLYWATLGGGRYQPFASVVWNDLSTISSTENSRRELRCSWFLRRTVLTQMSSFISHTG